MKTSRLFILFLALLFAVAAPSRAQARPALSFDFFYDSLSPYGEWIEVGDEGLCWTPSDVDPDWAPYSDGYFAFTDGGWTWVSYEEFGGIVYHYGRWIHLDGGRWCWKPDYEWAPAWVSWRSSDDYVGWAPLPPEARWRPEIGFGIWVDRDYDIGPGYYNFCRVRDFGAPVLRTVIINRTENIFIIRGTVNITNITYNNSYGGGPVIFTGGPSFSTMSRFSSRPIPRLKLVQNANFDPEHWKDHRGKNGKLAFNSEKMGDQLNVFAPDVKPPKDFSPFKSKVKMVVPGEKVNKGWGMAKNPDEEKELRKEIQRQAKGFTPDSAPARAVGAAEFKDVPKKGDANVSGVPPMNDKKDKFGAGKRTENVVSPPDNTPPSSPLDTPKGKNKIKNPPESGKSENLKPFNTDVPGNSKGFKNSDNGQSDKAAADAAKMRADQERAARMKDEYARQKQAEAAQQDAAKMKSDQKRYRDSDKPQRGPEQFPPQQKQQQFQPQSKQKPQNFQPPGQPPPTGKGQSSSKDSKGKDKDKDKNGN